MEVTILPSGKKVELDPNRILTKENVISDMEIALKDKGIDYETLMTLSFYMDFAISTKDIAVIDRVHNRITCHILKGYQKLID